jgi:hypothetical protein
MLSRLIALAFVAVFAVACASGPGGDPCVDPPFETPACTPPDARDNG